MILGKTVTAFDVGDTTSVALCQSHSNQFYTKIQSVACESCGTKPQKGEHINRHCPHPASVNMYLTIVSNSPSYLTEESIICRACYQHFKNILKNLEKGKLTNFTKLSQEERDLEVDGVMTLLSDTMANIYQNRTSAELGDYIQYIACIICKRVG